MDRARRANGAKARATAAAAVVLPLSFASVDGGHIGTLPQRPGPRGVRTSEQAAIERQPICIGSAVASAGSLSDVLYYRATRTDDGKLVVGYFAFFSEERPWGNNWLTWSVAPAIAVDLVYSRALFVAPGLQRAIYGAGDVEGVAVVYAPSADGSLHLEYAVSEDRTERSTVLARGDVFALDATRPTFYSDVWSHQLGARGARSLGDLTYRRCYDESAIRPLPNSVDRAFRLEGRADSAHVERIPGQRVN